MTVSTTTTRVIYRGNGAAVNFAVPFKVLDEDHLVVRRRVFATGLFEHTYIGTDYSYSGIGDSSGTLTLSGTALADAYELVIERIVPFTQDLDIVNAGGFYPDTVEEQLDLMVMSDQQLDDIADRALLVPEGEIGLTIPREADRIAKFLGFDADGDATVLSGTGNDSALRTDLAEDGAAVHGAALVGTADGGSVQTRLDALDALKATNADLDVEEAARIAGDAALGVLIDATEADIAAAQAALATGTVSALVDTRTYATKAALDADLAHAAGTFALVYADADVTLNDLYVKTGASGAGSWGATGIFAGAAQALVQPLVDAAEAAQLAAETAQTGAETAETGALAAQAAIEAVIGTAPIDELPATPVDGQVERWGPTGEIIHRDDSQSLWLIEGGAPLANVVIRFDGEAGQAVDSYYEIDHWRADRDFQARMSPFRLANSIWPDLNGDGTASFNGSSTSSTTIVPGVQLPQGCSDFEGHFAGIPGADANGEMRLYRTDARTSSIVQLKPSGLLEIADHVQGSSAPIVLQSKAVAGLVNTDDHTVHVRYDGHVVTAEHRASGTLIQAVSRLGAGNLLGFGSRRANTRFREIVAYPRDMAGAVELGDMRSLGGRSLVGLPDCDALNGLDMGSYALFGTVTSTNVNSGAPATQGPAKIHLFRREKKDGAITFLAEVDANTNQTTSDRITKIEGICVFLIAGVVHIAVADQGAHRVMLYRAPNPSDLQAVGKWPRVILNTQNTYNAQMVEAIDLGDGKVRLFCTYEGTASTTGMDNGGVISWRYDGGNSLTKANWTEVHQCAAPGAWGALKGQKVVDLLGDGRRLFVFGCRGTATAFRNVDGLGGIFYFDVDEGGIDAAGKTRVTIRQTPEDVIMVDLFDLGAGHGMDLAYTDVGPQTVNMLERDNAWAKTTLAMPASADTSDPWNLWNSGHRANGASILLAVMGNDTGSGASGLYPVWYDGAAWTYGIGEGQAPLMKMQFGHPFDKSVLYRFEMWNGLYDWMGGDSGGNFGRAFTFKQTAAIGPLAAPAIIPTYEAEADALFAAAVTAGFAYTDERKEIENELIAEAKDCGAWALLGALWIPAAHAAAVGYLNWKDPANHTLAPIGGITFTADRGVQGDGVDDYLDPSLDLTVTPLGITINDMCAGSVRMVDGGTASDIGSANGALWVQGRNTVNGGGRISRTNAILTFGTVANNPMPAPYHLHVQRTGVTAESLDANGEQKVTGGGGSTALPDAIYLLRTTTTYSAALLGAAYIGQAFTSTTMRLRFSLALMRRMAKVTGL